MPTTLPLWCLIAGLFVGLPLHAQMPDFVGAAERGGPPPPDPARHPEAWLIAHVDVETTGLVPGWHEMIDIGIVLTDLEGAVRESFFVRILIGICFHSGETGTRRPGAWRGSPRVMARAPRLNIPSVVCASGKAGAAKRPAGPGHRWGGRRSPLPGEVVTGNLAA